MEKLLHIASQFSTQGTIESIKPFGDGLINDTYLIRTEQTKPNYILQRKNKNIFTDIPAMMNNIYIVTTHLKNKIKIADGNPDREALTLVRTNDNKFHYIDSNKDYWTACVQIEDIVTHQSANSLELAYKGGQGIGRFQAMLSDMTTPLADILPGFHNMKYRFKQWDNSLSKNLANRKDSLQTEISWIESRRELMLALWEKVETGEIPTRVTHNDTKINNFLFNEDDDVLCVIDLDTVLNSTVLNDYGDAIRTFTNPGKEDDKDLENVYIDMDVFKSYTEGYISEASSFLSQSELDNLAFAAKYITFEQTLRFLMDYIDGDTYYRTSYDDHNLVRTRAQYKLLQSMEDNFDQMENIVRNCIK